MLIDLEVYCYIGLGGVGVLKKKRNKPSIVVLSMRLSFSKIIMGCLSWRTRNECE